MLLDTTKAAAYLGAAKHQLIYWRRQGYGPAYVRRGRSIGYRREALDTWRDWCVAFCKKYGDINWCTARRWSHKLVRRPGCEGMVPKSDLMPPLLGSESSQ